jgi:hypothetical protein
MTVLTFLARFKLMNDAYDIRLHHHLGGKVERYGTLAILYNVNVFTCVGSVNGWGKYVGSAYNARFNGWSDDCFKPSSLLKQNRRAGLAIGHTVKPIRVTPGRQLHNLPDYSTR